MPVRIQKSAGQSLFSKHALTARPAVFGFDFYTENSGICLLQPKCNG